MPVKAFVNVIKYDLKTRDCFDLIPADGRRSKTNSFAELCRYLASHVEQQIVFLGIQKPIRITVEEEVRK